jgi:hypothetical protein
MRSILFDIGLCVAQAAFVTVIIIFIAKLMGA